MNVESLRTDHETELSVASNTLRRLRKTPDDQDIDQREAMQLIHGAKERQVLFDEIDRQQKRIKHLETVWKRIADSGIENNFAWAWIGGIAKQILQSAGDSDCG